MPEITHLKSSLLSNNLRNDKKHRLTKFHLIRNRNYFISRGQSVTKPLDYIQHATKSLLDINITCYQNSSVLKINILNQIVDIYDFTNFLEKRKLNLYQKAKTHNFKGLLCEII